jgi:hypothetical protein
MISRDLVLLYNKFCLFTGMKKNLTSYALNYIGKKKQLASEYDKNHMQYFYYERSAEYFSLISGRKLL